MFFGVSLLSRCESFFIFFQNHSVVVVNHIVNLTKIKCDVYLLLTWHTSNLRKPPIYAYVCRFNDIYTQIKQRQ